jgi:Tol biopolymer transport system component
VPTTGGEPVKVLDAPKDGGDMDWSPDGRSLLYVREVDGVSNLWTWPLDGGQPRQLTDWQADKIFWFTYSRDGKQLAVSRGNTSQDAVLIKDFR